MIVLHCCTAETTQHYKANFPQLKKTQKKLKKDNLNYLKNKKNLPVNVGDTGSIPGPGRSHMPQGN